MYSLSKSERLCSKISTTELFSKGRDEETLFMEIEDNILNG